MPHFDLALEELRRYKPDVAVPDDLDQFWKATLAAAREHELAARFTRVDTGLVAVETHDVTFAGYGGAPVKGWLHLPAQRTGRLPAVVEYVGYGGGRGLAHERLFWSAAGYAHLIMDTRGQGSAWSVGDTPDTDGAAPAHPGYLTRGILDPETYYYRRVFTDAARAVEAVRSHPAVDPGRVVVAGRSQGGAIAIAVSGLVDDLRGVLPDVPFLCDVRRAVSIVDTMPYFELVTYLKVHRDHVERAFRTLSYFDGTVLGRRATAPALFSVGLMDQICPPSTVFAAYHHYAGPDKDIAVYPYNEHEGGEGFQQVAQLRWLADLPRPFAPRR
ncbi:MAG: acetylxylan esterase [Actinobacteria bacterium 13_2_20CM_2_72_6]|nr:MAG: acetylxylan esterase [Actinobacteria bacterium 13_2_20CM_2_72_6]